MPHELAKQLMQAGFPLKSHTKLVAYSSANETENLTGLMVGEFRPSNMGPDWALMPTLEELIEACGRDNIDNLGPCMSDQWYATNDLGGENNRTGYGTTPTEAVARLWLALNATK